MLCLGLLLAVEAEEAPVLIRSFVSGAEPAPPFEEGEFVPREGETISFLGGTNTFELDRTGDLELRFHLAWPNRLLRIRNLAWQGDVVGYQARPRHFYTESGDPQPGSLPDQRKRTHPGIIFVWFGKLESLEGGDAFSGYESLVAQLVELSPRVVLVAPTPFFPCGPAADLTEARNRNLESIVSVIRETARKHGLILVDLFTPLRDQLDPGLSRNGVHLTQAGHRVVAREIAAQLKFPAPPDEREGSEAVRPLQEAIDRKNRLWQQYYRPTNWAFLFGNRQHVPASRDPVEREERWFLREIRALEELLVEADAGIHRYAGALAGSESSGD